MPELQATKVALWSAVKMQSMPNKACCNRSVSLGATKELTPYWSTVPMSRVFSIFRIYIYQPRLGVRPVPASLSLAVMPVAQAAPVC